MYACDSDTHAASAMHRYSRAKTLVRLTLLGSAALIGLSAVLPAFAQTVENQSTDLDAIVVTAQRRSERLQDVPITITNLTSDQLTDANVRSSAEI